MNVTVYRYGIVLLICLLSIACQESTKSESSERTSDSSEHSSDSVTQVGDMEVVAEWTIPTNKTYNLAPEPPYLLRDVHLINDDVEFTQPYVPGHRTSMDGRIALRVQGGYPGTERIATHYSFFLFVPEKLQQPIMDGPPGAQILADSEPFDVVFPPALEPNINRFGHHVICDPTEYFEVAGEKPNPYLCGADQKNDCYDLTLISSTASGLIAQLWSTQVTIEVTQPKTKNARIVRAELGEPQQGPQIMTTNELLEPAITRDGKLLTARLGRAPRTWINPNTGESKMGFYDLVYFPPKEGMEPCDVMAWDEWHPMSHAPYDPRMKGKYGLAAYPFRDSEGQVIPDGDDLGGTYPWVDREGANVFMAGIPGRMIEQSTEEYPRVCVFEGCDEYRENNDWDRGYLVGGLWTHGKFVLLDAMINHLDWSIGVTPETHYLVDLYQDTQGNAVPVRLGSGRFIDAFRMQGGPYPAGYTHNANILDSVQNLMNQHEFMKPITPRDIVWLMSNGVATDEVVFDDFLDPHALIVSNMQASITQFYSEDGKALSIPKYWNGQVRRLVAPVPLPSVNELMLDEAEEVHVQNGATSLEWNPPAYGVIEATEGRIEPAALGGIKGKGIWMNGNNQITYEIPKQPQDIRQSHWMYSIFIDPRGEKGETRILLTFPDQSLIEWENFGVLRYVKDRKVLHTITLPHDTSQGWTHLAWRVDPSHRWIELIYNGFPFDRFKASSELFVMSEGQFKVGDRTHVGAGFRGWIDELKVLAHDVNPEVMCNHAHGTLIKAKDHPQWRMYAELYPEWAHQVLMELLGENEETRFACFHDYSKDHGAHLGNIPSGTLSVREAINFPEGPVYAHEPRPDSSQNRFCLECHHAEGKGGLGLEALQFKADVPAELDRRRQPSQPPRRVFGNIPAQWLEGSPAESQQAPLEGFLIDRWLHQDQ